MNCIALQTKRMILLINGINRLKNRKTYFISPSSQTRAQHVEQFANRSKLLRHFAKRNCGPGKAPATNFCDVGAYNLRSAHVQSERADVMQVIASRRLTKTQKLISIRQGQRRVPVRPACG